MERWNRQRRESTAIRTRPKPERADAESLEIEASLLQSAQATMRAVCGMASNRYYQAQEVLKQWDRAGREQWEIDALKKEVKEVGEELARVQELFDGVDEAEKKIVSKRYGSRWG